MSRRMNQTSSGRRVRNRRQRREAGWLRRHALRLGLAVAGSALLLVMAQQGVINRGIIWGQQQVITASAKAGLQLHDVTLTGRQVVSREEILAALQITPQQPLMAIKMEEAAQRLRQLPWVKDVRLQRIWPNRLHVELRERQPVALWQQRGNIQLVDGDGKILPHENPASMANMVLLVGSNAPQRLPELYAMLAPYPELQQQLDAASWIGGRRWDMRLKNGISVKLPEHRAPQMLARLARLNEEQQLLQRQITQIDLRLPDRIVLRTTDHIRERKAVSQEPI